MDVQTTAATNSGRTTQQRSAGQRLGRSVATMGSVGHWQCLKRGHSNSDKTHRTAWSCKRSCKIVRHVDYSGLPRALVRVHLALFASSSPPSSAKPTGRPDPQSLLLLTRPTEWQQACIYAPPLQARLARGARRSPTPPPRHTCLARCLGYRSASLICRVRSIAHSWYTSS